MDTKAAAHQLLAAEGHALLSRLGRVRPFALQMTMAPAAAVSIAAQHAIEQYLHEGRTTLRRAIREYLQWLDQQHPQPAEAQRRFSFLRLRFNAMLSQFDIFADALVQRSEHGHGIQLAGLDAVAADALRMEEFYEAPPVICYLDRGHGAAIRRARTRLPGGGENPVAVIRVPRERMLGSSIASSLVHEVGHQGAALLDLIHSLRRQMGERIRRGPDVWRLWDRWISEIVADLWSVAKVGIASTLGLMGVASLPRAFVFRFGGNDPHPFPWIRVKLSCAMGEALYPEPQWAAMGRVWEELYPPVGLHEEDAARLRALEQGIPEFVEFLTTHVSRTLRGQTLGRALRDEGRQPARLRLLFDAWSREPERLRRAQPSVVFAGIGQARADGSLAPADEARWLDKTLTWWALQQVVEPAVSLRRQIGRSWNKENVTS